MAQPARPGWQEPSAPLCSQCCLISDRQWLILPASCPWWALLLAGSQDLAIPASGMQGSIITAAWMMLPTVHSGGHLDLTRAQ